jgi:hypothetical protein
MNRKHSVIIGTIAGLVIGAVMFDIGLWLRQAPESFPRSLFLLAHAPVIGVLTRVRESTYDWNTSAGLSQVMAAFLVYWALLGTLAALGWRTILSRRHTSHVA